MQIYEVTVIETVRTTVYVEAENAAVATDVAIELVCEGLIERSDSELYDTETVELITAPNKTPVTLFTAKIDEDKVSVSYKNCDDELLSY